MVVLEGLVCWGAWCAGDLDDLLCDEGVLGWVGGVHQAQHHHRLPLRLLHPGNHRHELLVRHAVAEPDGVLGPPVGAVRRRHVGEPGGDGLVGQGTELAPQGAQGRGGGHSQVPGGGGGMVVVVVAWWW